MQVPSKQLDEERPCRKRGEEFVVGRSGRAISHPTLRASTFALPRPNKILNKIHAMEGGCFYQIKKETQSRH